MKRYDFNAVDEEDLNYKGDWYKATEVDAEIALLNDILALDRDMMNEMKAAIERQQRLLGFRKEGEV